MAQALIRNLDDDLLQDYRALAKRNRRSLEAELREALHRMRPRQGKSHEELLDLSRRIRAMTPDVAQTPAEEVVRALRDE